MIGHEAVLNKDPYQSTVQKIKRLKCKLCFEDHKLGHNKIKHVRSGGEQSLPVEGKIVKVDR